MSVRMVENLLAGFTELRHEPIGRRVRGLANGDLIVDSVRAMLVFDAFDMWLEEDERIYSHPREPFHAMAILPSSRDVRIELDGVLLAASSRAKLLFEGAVLPTRAYLPREDVLVPLMPTDKRTVCAYKGEASYFTVEIDGRVHENLAWTYEQPLRTATDVAGLVAFFNERVDVILDGEALPRAVTPWS